MTTKAWGNEKKVVLCFEIEIKTEAPKAFKEDLNELLHSYARKDDYKITKRDSSCLLSRE